MLSALLLAGAAAPISLRVPVNETTDTARYTPGVLSPDTISHIAPFFKGMPVDPYLKQGTRTRLYGKYRLARLNAEAPRLAEYMTNVFIQTGAYNDLVKRGEVALVRKYERLPHGFMETVAAQTIIDQCADDMLAMGAPPDTPFEFSMHAIRVSAPGNPTPEGTHQDGYASVCSAVIGRTGVDGGHSRVHTGKYDDSVLDLPMMPGDLLVVNDQLVYHSVSNLTVLPGHHSGFRDVLVITARPWRGGRMGEDDGAVGLLQLEGITEAPNPTGATVEEGDDYLASGEGTLHGANVSSGSSLITRLRTQRKLLWL